LIAADAYIKSQTDDLSDLTAKQQQFQKNKVFKVLVSLYFVSHLTIIKKYLLN